MIKASRRDPDGLAMKFSGASCIKKGSEKQILYRKYKTSRFRNIIYNKHFEIQNMFEFDFFNNALDFLSEIHPRALG